MQIISRLNLYAILCACRRAEWLTFTAITKPEMISPWGNVFKKVSVVRVRLNCDYQRQVNRRRRVEAKPATFRAGSLPWGEWDFEGSPFIVQGNKLYLRVTPVSVVERYYVTLTGEQLTHEQIKPLLKRTRRSSRQKLDQPVQVRTYAFDNIRRIMVDGQSYYRAGRNEVKLS